MHKTFCNGCQKELTGQVYYQISEIEKNLPTNNPKKWLHLRQGETEVVGQEESWLAYLDLHFCERCIQNPIAPLDLLKLSGIHH